MTVDKKEEVIIYLYRVIDGDGVHRFRTTNSYFIEHLGGIGAVEERLGSQFQFVELIGTCPFRVGNTGQGFDDIAGNDIATKIKAIAHQYPNCDPLPQPWSAGERRKDIAKSVCESISVSSDALNKEIISDLIQIQTAIGADIDVIALIHHDGRLLAGPVLQDALLSGFALHDGGVPVDKGYVSILPDPASGSPHWKSIPPEELSIPLFPPDENRPVAYLVICPDGRHAVALAGRRYGGHVGWSGNSVLIDRVTRLLADVGVFNRTRRSAPHHGKTLRSSKGVFNIKENVNMAKLNAIYGRQSITAEKIAMVVYDVSRREMRKYFIKASCIATTRIIVNLFEHFGFEALPLHVDTAVWNPAWVNALRCGNQPSYSLSKEATDRWMDERGAWNIGTNEAAMDEPVRHLVAYIPALSCVIDASIDQFNRPARKINLPKCVRFSIDPASLSDVYTWRIQRNSCWIYYSRVLDDRGAWRLSSDWTGNAGTAAVQNALIRRVEKLTGRKAADR